ncbi:GntR family transcriptional regulator [Ornithinimicrobium cavernae]|uniref:GntR family transcriptional regulator n=1 Tax=Ornithinimicrobium cavernae TaxID=2666047 RepID=UPI00137AC1FA|nr:GntR family transcriptional regulator [Ornithinimicrobium cavernae]
MTQRTGSGGSARQAAVTTLREWILEGRLLPGARLVQEQLAAGLGLSRIPVREALRTLEAEGLVVHQESGGFFVARIDVQTLENIQRVRELLEAEAVRQAGAAGRLGPELAEATRLIQEQLTADPLTDISRVAGLTRSLHFTLLGACENPIILRILGNLWDSTDAWRTIYYGFIFAVDAKHREIVFADHEKLIELIRAAETEKIIRLLDNMRSRGISAVEKAVAAHQARPQWQAQQVVRALQDQND